MLSSSSPALAVSPVKRSMTVVALLGALMVAGPLAPAWAQTSGKIPPSQGTAMNRAESVEQRITSLHAELKITPAQESDWKAVAQAMRDEAAAMQKLAADKQSQPSMTAVEDLQTYADFAQAHVDGLKNIISSFQTLYDSMPAAQKKLADQVFQNSQRQRAAHAG